MKTSLMFLLCLIFSHTLFAQKCKYDINKKDAFTGEQTNAIIHKNRGWVWTSMKKGDKLLIEMTFLHAGDIQKPMAVTDSVLVKLADGTVLHLKPSSEVPPFNQSKSYTQSGTSTSGRYSSATTSTMEVTSFSPIFQLERSVYGHISRTGIVAIRMDFTGKPIDLDFTVKPLLKSVEPIMNNAKCILALN